MYRIISPYNLDLRDSLLVRRLSHPKLYPCKATPAADWTPWTSQARDLRQ